MKNLISGFLRFRKDVFSQWRDYFHLLGESQAPNVLFITCANGEKRVENCAWLLKGTTTN